MQSVTQVGPIDVRAHGLTANITAGLPLNVDTKALTEPLPFGAGFPKVPHRCAAAASKGGLVVRCERVEIGEKFVHGRIIPKGNDKSIPFGPLPLGNEFGQYAMDIQTHRKLRLRELIDWKCGKLISKLAADTGISESYASRMLYPPDKVGGKPVSDKKMLLMERIYKLERAWLDLPLGSAMIDSRAVIMEEPQVAPSTQLARDPNPSYLTAPLVAANPAKDWPFQRVTPGQYGALLPTQKHLVENTILVLLGAGQQRPEKSGSPEQRTAKPT